ncbi:MAG: hypothetical protein GX620_08970 [Chloroflexi bacterium]|nr:hypothetical protein [Chloroflexota bacterium]
MLDLDIRTIAFQVVNFLILAAALYHLLFKPVMRSVQERTAERQRLRRNLEDDTAKANHLRGELETRLAGTADEAAAIIVAAQEEAEALRLSLLQEALAEVERILTEAHADAHRQQQLLLRDFEDDLVETVLRISARMIGRTIPRESHDALVQQLSDRIWEMGRSEMLRVEDLRRSLGTRSPTVFIRSARQLTPEQQALLSRTFAALADRQVNVEVKTDPLLAAGVRARIGDLIIDNSIAGQLDELHDAVALSLKERLADE